jgi:hypothetical protein
VSTCFFEEITGIRSQVPAIFIENNEVILGDFNYFIVFDLVLQMCANGASCQELQIAPKNRFHTNFLRKLWTYHFLFSP